MKTDLPTCHYEFTGELFLYDNTPLHQIRALIDLPHHGVKAGDIGGYIQSEKNLQDEAWVAFRSMVLDEAVVADSALVTGGSVVRHNSEVSGRAMVGEKSHLSDFSKVTDDAVANGVHMEGFSKIYENAKVKGASMSGGSKVYGNATVDGSYVELKDYAEVFGSATVKDQVSMSGISSVSEEAQVSGKVKLRCQARIGGSAVVSDNAVIGGDVVVCDKANITDDAMVCGVVWVYGNALIADKAIVRGIADIGGNAQIRVAAYIPEGVYREATDCIVLFLAPMTVTLTPNGMSIMNTYRTYEEWEKCDLHENPVADGQLDPIWWGMWKDTLFAMRKMVGKKHGEEIYHRVEVIKHSME